jgi:glycosidase
MYYGEELGQRNIEVPRERAFDPFARHAEPGRDVFNRDQCRGPIAWNGTAPGFGFSTGTPWLPISPDAAERNVAVASTDPDSVLSWYRQLLAFRRATPALSGGGQELLDVADPDVLAYLRDAGGGGRAFIALNFTDRPTRIDAPTTRPGVSWRVGLSTHARPAQALRSAGIELAPLEALIAVEG